MASKKRVVVGSVVKAKEKGDTDYIKIKSNIDLKQGESLSLETKQSQITNLEKAMADGKVSAELGGEIMERLQRIPDWVRFEIVKYVDKK